MSSSLLIGALRASTQRLISGKLLFLKLRWMNLQEAELRLSARMAASHVEPAQLFIHSPAPNDPA